MSIEGIEQKSQEAIVNEILAGQRLLMRPTADGFKVICLKYGSKDLHVSLSPERGSVVTSVVGTDGVEKKPNETTLLYTAAKKLMESFALETGKAVTYKLKTYNENMGQWASEKGREVFDWDSEDVSVSKENGKTCFEYEKSIFPPQEV